MSLGQGTPTVFCLIAVLVVLGCATPNRIVLDRAAPPSTDREQTFGLYDETLPAADDGRHVFILRPQWATMRSDGSMQWTLVLPDGVSGLRAVIEIYSRREPEAAGTAWRVGVTPTRSGVAVGPPLLSAVTPSHVSAVTNGVAKQTAPLLGFTDSREYLVNISAASDPGAARFVLATVRIEGEGR